MAANIPTARSARRNLVGLLIVGLVWSALSLRPALASPASPAAAASVPSPSVLDAITRSVLDDINLHGWNQVTNKGLLINWLEGDASKNNLPSGGPTLHDQHTDLRDLINMTWYEKRHPGDTSQKSFIDRLTPVVKAEFKGYASDKGWVYWQFLRLGAISGDSTWIDEARYFAAHISRVIDPATGVSHGLLSLTTGPGSPQCTDGYRVDHDLESGLALVDAARRFSMPAWANQGAREVSVVTSQAFSVVYQLYPRAMCLNQVWDPIAKTGEVAEEIQAYLTVGQYTGNNAYLTRAKSMLDNLLASNLHDKTNGGFYFYMDLQTGKVSAKSKETRQLTLLTAALLADAIFPGRYTALVAELKTVAQNMEVPSPFAGYRSEETPTYQVVVSNKVAHDWVTSEADGIALEAIQSVL